MEILQDFDFDYREPRSQWAPFIKTLIEGVDGRPVHAVKLIAGRDFPEGANLDNVHNGRGSASWMTRRPRPSSSASTPRGAGRMAPAGAAGGRS
jgi:hypothetical protein